MTATPAMAERLGTILLDLLDHYPHVRFELELTDRNIDLIGEGFDLALRAGKLGDSSLIARQLPSARSGYFASPAYLAAHPKLTHPSQLVDHTCIVFTGSQRAGRWGFEIDGKHTEITVRGRVVANSLAIVRMAAIDEHGVAWLPHPLSAHPVEAGTLIPVLKKFWLPPTPIQLVYPSSRSLAPQVRVAIEVLARELAKPDRA
jgi:DNA-binding transcriptional LysR family regulator